MKKNLSNLMLYKCYILKNIKDQYNVTYDDDTVNIIVNSKPKTDITKKFKKILNIKNDIQKQTIIDDEKILNQEYKKEEKQYNLNIEEIR